MPIGLPEEVVARFCATGLERVQRLESLWNALLESPTDGGLAGELGRELHTLKGDSRIVGFTDLNLLCHKLEDLLSFAHKRRYKVPEQFDIAVAMGFGFLSLLLRSRAGAARGVDLPGFIVTLDQVLSEERSQTEDEVPGKRPEPPPSSVHDPGDRLGFQARANLAAAATDVYLAFLTASGKLKERLHSTWFDLRRQVTALAEIPLGARVDRHGFGARELARTLGKNVDVSFELGDSRVPPEVANAIDIVLLHAFRNAVDHGVETPAERAAAGKVPAASITVRALEANDRIELLVEDDGRGIDFEKVRRRARELGLLTPNASDGYLIELLFRPGFSTTKTVTELSGRGVGLDAAKVAVMREGGRVAMTIRPGGGVRLTLSFPRKGRRMLVHPLTARAGIKLAISADWTVAVADTTELPVYDLLDLVGIGHDVLGEASGTITRVTRDDLDFRFAVAYSGAKATVERHCPTLEGHPCEVVSLNGEELLLLRLDIAQTVKPRVA